MYQRKSQNRLLPLFIGIGLLAALAAGLMIYRAQNAPPADSVMALLGREHRMLVLRLPAVGGVPQEQLIVHENTEFAPYPRRATRSLVEEEAAFALDLSREEWQELNNLRENWCYMPGVFSPTQRDEPVYEVAVRCGLANQHYRIPLDELPPVLERLIERVPSSLEQPALQSE